jgi:hypothetical protein
VRYTARRKRELATFNSKLAYPQPVRGPHLCVRCGVTFLSEAGFTYHQRPKGTKGETECLGERVLRRAGFTTKNGKTWHTPRDVELWYLDRLETGGESVRQPRLIELRCPKCPRVEHVLPGGSGLCRRSPRGEEHPPAVMIRAKSGEGEEG